MIRRDQGARAAISSGAASEVNAGNAARIAMIPGQGRLNSEEAAELRPMAAGNVATGGFRSTSAKAAPGRGSEARNQHRSNTEQMPCVCRNFQQQLGLTFRTVRDLGVSGDFRFHSPSFATL
jgi:hypothetical protein